MAEKQPTAYVVCRWSQPTEKNNYAVGDNTPFKVFDTRREARAFVKRLEARTSRYGYNIFAVKHG